ncbi:hypothetical protein KUG12_07540, partial [Streptomyces sp. BV333]|uniref:hypothetical protein n=1 Tax=Streptomyces sp. BV333 TaxID=2849673 RepID=UPI001C2EA974
MDWTEAWSKTAVITKSGRRASAAQVTNALDALGSMCAPLAARWDAEADRRTKLRTPENLKALMVAQ